MFAAIISFYSNWDYDWECGTGKMKPELLNSEGKFYENLIVAFIKITCAWSKKRKKKRNSCMYECNEQNK